MKNPVRKALSFLLTLVLVLACTKEISLKTEVEFSLTEQHIAVGHINEALPTTVTVVPEAILEEFSYSFAYSISDGEGHFEDSEGNVFPKDEHIALNPLSASMMFVSSKAGKHMVTVTATDNYGFTEEVEIDYTLTEIPLKWTATSAMEQIELGKSARITVTLESTDNNPNTTYERNYDFVSGSGILMSLPEEEETIMGEFRTILPGTYQLNFTPNELGTIRLSFDLRDSNGQEFTQVVSFEVFEDIEEDGRPRIELLGADPLTIDRGETYEDPGAMAFDDEEGDISENLVVDFSQVDTSTVGTYTVTYNVSDVAGNAAVEVARTVTVGAAPNNPPLANNFSVSVVGNSTNNQIDVSAEISDPENDALTVTIQGSGPANGTATVSGTVISYTPNNGYSGNDIITYLVSDGNNPAVSGTITVTVDGSPTAVITPVFFNTGTLAGRYSGGNSTDPEFDTLSYQWNFGDPDSGVLNESFGEIVTHTFSRPDTYTITLTVFDGNGGSDSETLTVTVNPPPTPSYTFIIDPLGPTVDSPDVSFTFRIIPNQAAIDQNIQFQMSFRPLNAITDPRISYNGKVRVVSEVFSVNSLVSNAPYLNPHNCATISIEFTVTSDISLPSKTATVNFDYRADGVPCQ